MLRDTELHRLLDISILQWPINTKTSTWHLSLSRVFLISQWVPSNLTLNSKWQPSATDSKRRPLEHSLDMPYAAHDPYNRIHAQVETCSIYAHPGRLFNVYHHTHNLRIPEALIPILSHYFIYDSKLADASEYVGHRRAREFYSWGPKSIPSADRKRRVRCRFATHNRVSVESSGSHPLSTRQTLLKMCTASISRLLGTCEES